MAALTCLAFAGGLAPAAAQVASPYRIKPSDVVVPPDVAAPAAARVAQRPAVTAPLAALMPLETTLVTCCPTAETPREGEAANLPQRVLPGGRVFVRRA